MLTRSRQHFIRRELALEAAIARFDKFHLLVLDDLAYFTKNQARDQRALRADSAPVTSGGHG